MKEQFVNYFKTLSLNDQAEIIGMLQNIRTDHFNEMYRVVEIYNYSVNISDVIRKCTGFQATHRSGSVTGSIGTNRVLVPRELYTTELESALVGYFSDFSTGHTAAGWHDIVEKVIND